MDRFFAHSTSGVTSTYTGPFNFLEDGNQAVFTSIFGVKPTPLWMDSVKKGLPMENAEGLKTKLLPFVSLCHLFIFCSIVYRRYVGTSDYDKTQIITDVEEALSDIKLERQMRGQLHTITLDDLYREYQNFIPLLPADAQDWSFHLVVMFLNALPVDLKKTCRFSRI